VDGVSLTVVSVDPSTSSGEPDETFSVALIPQTKEGTGLGGLEEGDRVNVEGDILRKMA